MELEVKWEYVFDDIGYMKLYNMGEFIKLGEQFLREKLAEQEDKLEKAVAGLNDEDAIDSHEAEYLYNKQLFERDYQEFLFDSIYLSIFSTVEAEFISTCKRVQDITKHNLKYKDMSGNGIEQARNYLVKVHGFEIDNNQWGEFKTLSGIRNLIAHSQSTITEPKTLMELSDYASKIPGLSVITYQATPPTRARISINKEFCLYFINFSEQLLRSIHSKKYSLMDKIAK